MLDYVGIPQLDPCLSRAYAEGRLSWQELMGKGNQKHFILPPATIDHRRTALVGKDLSFLLHSGRAIFLINFVCVESFTETNF